MPDLLLEESDVLDPARQKGRSRLLPCDVVLTLGHRIVRLFRAGPFDEFTFFQRTGISENAQVEYLTYHEPRDLGRNREQYRPFAAFRFHAGEPTPLPDLRRSQDLGRRLSRGWGLDALPAVGRLNVERWSEFAPGRAEERGRNKVRASSSSGTFRRVKERDFGYVEVLEILRSTLNTPERIAWVEGAFHTAPTEVVHRYYLDCDVRPWLVRHFPSGEKLLFAAELSTTVPRRGLIIYSGKLARVSVDPSSAEGRVLPA